MKTTVRDGLMAIALACGAQGLAAAATGTAPSMSVAPATVAVGTCDWNHPGLNPFTGDVVAAVDRYRDIPPEVRARLKARMARHEYDDLVTIRRDSIFGRGGYDYGSTISDMHFGTDRLCHAVTRAAWSPTMEERGLVYCESGHCILVPTVCRNVSRVTRRGVGNEAAVGPPLLEAPPAAEAAPPLAMNELPPIDFFGPTGAGVPEAAALPGEGGHGGIFPGGPVWSGGGIGGPGAPGVPGLPGLPGTPGVPGVPAVPEPHVWALMLIGLVAVLTARRRHVASH